MSSSNVFKAGSPSFQKVSPFPMGELKSGVSVEDKPEGNSSAKVKKTPEEIAAEEALLREEEEKAARLEEEEKEREREAELAEVKKQGYDEGFLKGKEEGVEETSKKLDPVMEGFLAAVKEVEEMKKTLLLESEKDVLELVSSAARKIVLRELSIDRELVVDVVKGALKSLTDRKEITICVNPEDYKIIHDQKKRFFGDVDYIKEITFVEDESVGRGGCLIESKFGEIDARINKQLEQLDEGIRNGLAKD